MFRGVPDLTGWVVGVWGVTHDFVRCVSLYVSVGYASRRVRRIRCVTAAMPPLVSVAVLFVSLLLPCVCLLGLAGV